MSDDPKKLERYDIHDALAGQQRMSLLELEVRRQRMHAEMRHSDFYEKIWTANNIRFR
jgi:hypothetical protein